MVSQRVDEGRLGTPVGPVRGRRACSAVSRHRAGPSELHSGLDQRESSPPPSLLGGCVCLTLAHRFVRAFQGVSPILTTEPIPITPASPGSWFGIGIWNLFHVLHIFTHGHSSFSGLDWLLLLLVPCGSAGRDRIKSRWVQLLVATVVQSGSPRLPQCCDSGYI